MTDVFSRKKRSIIMSRIKSKDTNLEKDFFKKMSSCLYKKGYRCRKHYKKIPGNPDIAFVRQKVAIFLDGDFWHGYNFAKIKNKLPKKYWLKKIEGNIKRDRGVNARLRKKGWTVLRFWEHQLKKNSASALKKIERAL